jgi:poly-gamma-glutamate synthesis protein (capsule biosynthesis protein)
MKRLLVFIGLLVLLSGCATATPTPTPSPTPLILPPTSTPSPTPTVTPTPLPPISLVDEWQYPTQENWDETEAYWTLDVADVNGDGVLDILAGSHDRYLYAFAADGAILWKFHAAASIYSALATGAADGLRVLVGDDSDRVYLVDAAGNALWQTRLDGRITHLAAVGDLFLAATWKGLLYALDGSGAVVWQVQLPGAPASLEAAPIGGADTLVGTDSGQVVGLTAKGIVAWDKKVSDVPVTARAANLGKIAWVSGDQGGNFAAWDENGNRLWEFRAGGGMPVWTAANLPSGPALLVGAGNPVNAVLALSPAGAILWKANVEGGVWDLAIADLDGDGESEILAATEGGTVTILSAGGQVRGTWYAPSRVAGIRIAALQPDGSPQIVVREGRFIHVLTPQVGGPPSPIPTPGPVTLASWDGLLPSEDDTILLAAGGDVMLARTVEEYANRYGADYPFAPVAPALRQADIAVANLECAVAAGGEPAQKTYVFRAHHDLAGALAASGLTAMSLANNHILDFGLDGFAETLQNLESQEIATLGAGANLAEAERPLVYDIRGVKVALLAWVSYAPPDFAAGDDRPGVAFLSDLNRMARKIQEAKERADAVVVILHGGKEYSFTSNAQQQTAARQAIDAGADLVVGHHPHVLQETEIYRGKLIVYSLGDLLFDIDNVDAARDGAVLWAWIGKDGVSRAELWRTRIVHDAQVRFLVGLDGQPVRQPLLP